MALFKAGVVRILICTDAAGMVSSQYHLYLSALEKMHIIYKNIKIQFMIMVIIDNYQNKQNQIYILNTIIIKKNQIFKKI